MDEKWMNDRSGDEAEQEGFAHSDLDEASKQYVAKDHPDTAAANSMEDSLYGTSGEAAPDPFAPRKSRPVHEVPEKAVVSDSLKPWEKFFGRNEPKAEELADTKPDPDSLTAENAASAAASKEAADGCPETAEVTAVEEDPSVRRQTEPESCDTDAAQTADEPEEEVTEHEAESAAPPDKEGTERTAEAADAPYEVLDEETDANFRRTDAADAEWTSLETEEEGRPKPPVQSEMTPSSAEGNDEAPSAEVGSDDASKVHYESRYDSYRFQTPPPAEPAEEKPKRKRKPMSRSQKNLLSAIGLFAAMLALVIGLAFATASILNRSGRKSMTGGPEDNIVLGRQEERNKAIEDPVYSESEKTDDAAASDETAEPEEEAEVKDEVREEDAETGNDGTDPLTEDGESGENAASGSSGKERIQLGGGSDVRQPSAAAPKEEAAPEANSEDEREVSGNDDGRLSSYTLNDGRGSDTELSPQELAECILPSVVAVSDAAGTEMSGVVTASSKDSLLILTLAEAAAEDPAEVHFADGTSAEAVILARTELLTALEVSKAALSDETLASAVPVALSEEEGPQLGQTVAALGRTEARGSAVYTGIVNAAYGDTDGDALTQTVKIGIPVSGDTAGGPVLNMRGELIGLCAESTEDSVSGTLILFYPAYNQLLGSTAGSASAAASSKGTSAYLGVTLETDTPETVRVGQVAEGGPADEAGILPADVILSVDEHTIISYEDLKAAIDACRPGDEVILTVRRVMDDGEASELLIPVTLGSKPDEAGDAAAFSQNQTESAAEQLPELNGGSKKGSLSGSYFGLFEDHSEDYGTDGD